MGFPCGLAGKESTCNEGHLGLIPGLGRCPGEGNSYPLQSSGLENSMDCMVPGVEKSQTQLSDFHFHSFIFGSAGSLLLWGLFSSKGYALLAVHRLLIAAASLVAEHRI